MTNTTKDCGALAYDFSRKDRENGLPSYTWSVVGPDGGVHIWAQARSDEDVYRWGERYYGGVEVHRRSPAEYQSEDNPSHDDCWLIGGKCWHDGTSLYFSERIGPMLSPENIEGPNIAEYMKGELHYWYRSNIAAPEATA